MFYCLYKKGVSKTICYKLQFIKNARFMASSLSNLVDNLCKELQNYMQTWNEDMMIKNKTYGVKYRGCECCLEYKNVKDDLILYKSLCCNRNY